MIFEIKIKISKKKYNIYKCDINLIKKKILSQNERVTSASDKRNSGRKQHRRAEKLM